MGQAQVLICKNMFMGVSTFISWWFIGVVMSLVHAHVHFHSGWDVPTVYLYESNKLMHRYISVLTCTCSFIHEYF